MQITEAADLIKNAFPKGKTPQTWADLGAGSGTFTKALAGHLADGSVVYAVDKSTQPNWVSQRGVGIELLELDFETDEMPLPALDGILMANSLHYVHDKTSLLEKLENYLKPGGIFLIVEYDSQVANPWVPYPLDFVSLKKLFSGRGYGRIEKLGERPSVFGRGNLYACAVSKP